MMSIALPHRRRGAFALVVVLIVLSLLAIIAVGYLSSMTSERATASAFSNRTRAEQAAQAAVDNATAVLRDAFQSYPDSVTVWNPQLSKNPASTSAASTQATYTEGTALYFRAVQKPNADGTAAPAESGVPDPAPGASDPSSTTSANYAGGNNPNNVDANGVDQRKMFVLPLVSGGVAKRVESITATTPLLTTDATNSINLNSRRQMGDTQGWLGTRPNYVDPAGNNPPFPESVQVPWIEIKQRDGITNPTNAPVIARYAFWIEDESFRANISYGALGENQNHQRRDNSQNFLLNPTDLDLLGLLKFVGDSDPATVAQNLFTTRKYYPGQVFPESRAFAHTEGLSTDRINELRFLTTSQSASLNLTRHGTQRLNLNAVVPAATLPTDTTAIQTQVDKIVQTIQFHAPNFGQRFYRNTPPNATSGTPLLVTDPSALNPMTVSHPLNGTDTTTPDHAKIYDYKIAANLRDYMDSDCVPTVIWDTVVNGVHTGQVHQASAPAIPFGDNGDNPVWAIGKDAAPFMQECAVRFRRTDGGTGTPFVMAIDYYVEFWNMSTKDVKGMDLGPNPFIRVSNPTRWEVNNSTKYTLNGATFAAFTTGADLFSDDADNVSPSSARTSLGRDYKIDLSNVTFPAGQVTVITTDASYTDIIKDAEALRHVVVCPFILPGKSIYKGHFPPGRAAAGKDVLNMVFDTVATTPGGVSNSSDYETDITVGSDWGFIDCLEGALPLFWGGRISVPYTGSSNNYPYVFGGELRGNWTNTSTRTTQGLEACALGDPRTNNEQLVYALNPPITLDPNAALDHSRWNAYDTIAGGNVLIPGPVPGSPDTGIIPTLGQPNYRSVRPNRPENPWGDAPAYYSSPDSNPTAAELVLTADKAPMPVANGALTSIGQLGDIYDPSRIIDYCAVTGSRGGGRSLKIGQHDDRWDGDETSASRTWTAWRLTDIFCTTDAIQQPGLININGLLRDGGNALQVSLFGSALRSALTGFKFQPDTAANPLGDPALHDLTDTTSPNYLNVDELVGELIARLKLPLVDPNTGRISTGVNQTGAGPFWERGELSELPGFGRTPDQYKPDSNHQAPATYPQTALVADVDMSSKVFDRGREELFRRLVEMVTTRGNVFTVYAVGQAIQTPPNDLTTKHITGTHQLKVTFCLVPKKKSSTGVISDFHPGTDANYLPADFDPNDSPSLNARFAKPDFYDVQILTVTSGNG